MTMKRVVIAGIPLNVISTYALLETGWKTVLGNTEQSDLFHIKTKFPLKISDRAWWQKVTLPKCKGATGTVPMDLSTGNVVNSGSTKTKQTKQTIDCKRNVPAVVPVDVVAKESVSKDLVSKDTSTKDM